MGWVQLPMTHNSHIARLEAMAQRLAASLRRYPSLLLAFSGGADSSLLLAAARKYSQQVLAVQCVGPLCPPWEKQQAEDLARALKVQLLQVDAQELQQPAIAANDELRCYYCKHHKMQLLLTMARRHGLATVADGSQLDDLHENRPGNRALRELEIKSPLQEAGFSKLDVKALSTAWNLPTARTAPSACMATRIAPNTPLREPDLLRVGLAEQGLRPYFCGIMRLRDFFPQATLELELEQVAKAKQMQARLLSLIAAWGYESLDISVYHKP